MGLMELAHTGRIEPHEKLNGVQRPGKDDIDEISILLSAVLHTTIKSAVKEAIRECLLNIPGVRAVLWMKRAAHKLKLKLTRRSN